MSVKTAVVGIGIVVFGTLRAFAAPFTLYDPGEKRPVDYEKYGEFFGVGTSSYSYRVHDIQGLAKAVGEGIFPNESIVQDPVHKRLLEERKLNGSHWDFIDNKNYEVNFHKWAIASVDTGTKLFYTAVILERAGMWLNAIKAYDALAVHFPKTVAWTFWKTPWYMGPVALDKIDVLCRRHPELGFKLEGRRIRVINGFDDDITNDKFECNHGHIVKVSKKQAQGGVKRSLSNAKIVVTRGGDRVRVVQYDTGDWQLLVDGKPFIVKGVSYSPNPVGKSPDRGTLVAHRDWQLQDENHDGVHDSLFKSSVDENRNNRQDPNEKTVGDATLLKEMGANTIRAYHHIYNKPLFEKLYRDFGLRVIVGDLLGAYSVGSGADWTTGTDYADPKQRANMLSSVEEMVKDNKDEPYVLFWVLGNENVFGVANNSHKNPEAFYSLVDEAAQLIHRLDPSHPVAIANGDLKFLDKLGKYAPNVDIIGVNSYRGDWGYGRSFFQNVKEQTGRPVVLTEFGCPAYAEGYPEKEALDYQANYLANNWQDIMYHSAGSGVGNSIGGVVFEWLDEWWKANSDLPEPVKRAKAKWYESKRKLYLNLQPENHDAVPQFAAPFLDGWSYEEWFGIFGQGDGKHSPFLREPRPVYKTLQKLWNQH